ncbi:hypothetical protein ACET3Z_022519 [Daucus carota]
MFEGVTMVDEIVTCVMLLITGIAILVMIHVWIVERAFREQNGVGSGIALQRRTVSIDVIKKLPCFDYKGEVNEESQSNLDCAVCLEIFKEEPWRSVCAVFVKLELKWHSIARIEGGSRFSLDLVF